MLKYLGLAKYIVEINWGIMDYIINKNNIYFDC